ncbi:MAG: molybdenum cofactor biosynthesis protein MoaE [Halioglobus sp.]|nr:molybdenum cofactor biosynthesis protein MoaE [Halioglobus sp.]
MGVDGDSGVWVQEADFDIAHLQRELVARAGDAGAVATFTGYVRKNNASREVHTMELEHYEGMTESSIAAIVEDAAARWPVLAARVVHRVGRLRPGEQIVWVGVAAHHRDAAFTACEFIMDYLKTSAPLWKRECGPGGDAHWVAARRSDEERLLRWDVSGESRAE